jgi:hypothetical protein
MVWVTTVISALVLASVLLGFLAGRRPSRPGYPLPPQAVAGATRVGRVWTANDPLLVVDAEAAETWTGTEGEYERIFSQPLEVGGLRAVSLTPEIDEGPVDVFTLADGDLLVVSVNAADADEWDEFLDALGSSSARKTGLVEVPSGRLALFHAAAARTTLTVVEEGSAGDTPFADEMLLLRVPPGLYEVHEAVVDAPSYALQGWRVTRERI